MFKFIVIVHFEEWEFDHYADALRVATIYGVVVFFRTHDGGTLFEWAKF